MRWWLIFFRGMGAPFVLVVAAFLLSLAVWQVAEALGAPTLYAAGDLVFNGGFWASMFGWALFGWRLYTWQRGALCCRYCEGPLGRRRDGIVMYGRQLHDFRRCYNCNRVTPVESP